MSEGENMKFKGGPLTLAETMILGESIFANRSKQNISQPFNNMGLTIAGSFLFRYERAMVLRAHRSIYRHAVFCKL